MSRVSALRGGRAETPSDYDPEQSMAERREIQRNIRDLRQQMRQDEDALLDERSNKQLEYLRRLDDQFERTRQTTEAAVDAGALLELAEAGWKRSTRLTSGNVANGVDVDEFVSKCVTYMRQGRGILDDNGAGLSSTQRQRRGNRSRGAIGDDDDDEVGDEGDELNWAHLGRYACVPHVRRPALPGFLLGPLSVEKKVRKITKRTERLRINNLEEVRPQVLNVEDVARTEKTDLTAICTKILARLNDVQQDLQKEFRSAYDEDMDEAEQKALLIRLGLASNGNVDLMRFVVNPKSFGQTVENLFYVSFLIRDGRVAMEYDDDGVPSLDTKDVDESEENNKTTSRSGTKNQAVFELDMPTWRSIIEIGNIKEPLIPHRAEDYQQVSGSRGWYS